MARRDRDVRREASLNASAKMQLILNRPEESNMPAIGTDLPVPVSSSGKESSRIANGKLPVGTASGSRNSTPSIIADDPISRTIDEVIARSVQLVDRTFEPVISDRSSQTPTVSLVNGNRRKQTTPRQRHTDKSPSTTVILTTPSIVPFPRKSKSKSPIVANGPSTASAQTFESLPSVSPKDPCRDPISVPVLVNHTVEINDSSSSYPVLVAVFGKNPQSPSRIKTNERDDSPTRYFLAVPESADVTSATDVQAQSPIPARKSPGISSRADSVKRKRSTSRTPIYPPSMRKEKLATLLRKRKPPPESRGTTPSSSGRPAINNKTRALKQKPGNIESGEEQRPAVVRRKLDTIIAKRGETTVWSWRGRSFDKLVYSEVHKCNIQRTCYHAVKHFEGEVIKVGDCVHLRAGKGQKPHVGKVAAFWDDEKGDMMMTIFWYWRPEEVETGLRPAHGEKEVYVSNLRDENHVGCIDEKCYVLTLHQYACFIAQQKEDGFLYRRPKEQVVPQTTSLLLDDLPDEDTDLDLVYFADKGYDGKHKRFWQYHFRGTRLRKFNTDLFD